MPQTAAPVGTEYGDNLAIWIRDAGQLKPANRASEIGQGFRRRERLGCHDDQGTCRIHAHNGVLQGLIINVGNLSQGSPRLLAAAGIGE